ISAYGLMVVLPLAALLLGRRGAVLYALAVAAAFTGLYIIEKQGLIASPVTELNGLDDLAELYIYVGVAATVLWMLVTNLSKTLDRVRVQNTELQRTQAELQALNTQLEARVAERTEELRAAKEAAEAARDQALAADRLKSQFLASMSHELRTPLNAVLSFNKLLKLGTFGEVIDEQVEYLGKSIDSATHLLALINDVLDVTKIQSGMMKLFIEEDFDLNTEIASMADTAEKMLDGKPVTLIREIDAGLPTLTCDKRRVRQILLNLVSNAIKFTEEGSITLRATHTGDSVTLAVIDTGPGITPEQTEYIFEPFVQTEEGIKHAGGTGLGLPISKKLAEAHGGRLWVESTPGAGAAFHVRLPLTPRLELGEVAI
ncbi:MAG: sensor histidine kinase, partial [Anaerolineae bacterium]